MALPLLSLGARLLGSRAVGAGATQAVRGGAARTAAAGTTGAAGGTVAGQAASRGMGFKDIVKESTKIKNNVVSFKTGNASKGGQAAAAGVGGGVATTTSSTNRVAGDIQAATELSMDELAKQTKILQEIQQNTQQTSTNTQGLAVMGSGAAKPPPSEEEIKGRFGKAGAVAATIGKKADEKIPTSMSAFLGALGGMALTNPDKPENTRAAAEANLTAFSGSERTKAFGSLLSDGGMRGGKVSEEEVAANKGKRDAIVKRIERAGLEPDKQKEVIERLDYAFERGNEKSVQAIAEKYRMEGDEDTGAYQFRKSAAKFDIAAAEKFAASLGEEGVSDLERLQQARDALENDPEQLAKEEKAFRDKQLALRTASEKRMSEELYSKGFLGTQTAAQKKEMQLEQVEEKVAAKFGNEGLFGSFLEGAKRIGGDIFGYETEQEKAENEIKSKIAFREAEMREGGASERDIINMRKDMLAQIEDKSMMIPEAAKTRPNADTLGEKVQESDYEEQAKTASFMKGMLGGGNTGGTAATPDSKANQPVDATAIIADPSTKDSVGNMLKRLNDMRSMSAM